MTMIYLLKKSERFCDPLSHLLKLVLLLVFLQFCFFNTTHHLSDKEYYYSIYYMLKSCNCRESMPSSFWSRVT